MTNSKFKSNILLVIFSCNSGQTKCKCTMIPVNNNIYSRIIICNCLNVVEEIKNAIHDNKYMEL